MERRSLKKKNTNKNQGFNGIRIPLKPWFLLVFFFFRLLLSNYLNWKIHCDDHSSLSSTTAVQKWIISYILHIKITSVACFFSMQIFRTWENCTLADIKNSFYLLKIKQSAQSHLTSCEIRGDVEGYFCWRRKQRVFEKTATRCSSLNILAARARI